MIRPAENTDLVAIQALLAQNGMLTDGLDYSDFSGITLVAEREGTIVGFCQMIPAKPYAVLTEMAVDRDHWHQGYGPKLLDACELLLRVQGVYAWYACTWLSNTYAIKLLEKWGARCTGQGVSFFRSLR